uniref:Uncharacterized protein n=1 Tax=Mantoniella antarctica TaxID=81844 RepID=A0A7S0XHB4_9CHLO|mmetsp:Transcript_7475/g.18550  ORF Transcript_7475/g.18550 Transcript_7475/m.18550 type:complete len:1067 (+) Transcript_7475:244-3444(+)
MSARQSTKLANSTWAAMASLDVNADVMSDPPGGDTGKCRRHLARLAVVEQRLARVLGEQQHIIDQAAVHQAEVDRWRAKAEEADRVRDAMTVKATSAQARIDSLEEALQGLSLLVNVTDDGDDVRVRLEAEYGAELLRLQAQVSASNQEATNSMARERDALAAEELTRREKRRAQADTSELKDQLEGLQYEFNTLQVLMVEERARAKASISERNRELSVERVAGASALREATQAQVECEQERQRVKSALQAEADQIGQSRAMAIKLSERECELANERARIRMADAGREAAEEASHVLRQQLEGTQKSLSLYRAATGGSDQGLRQELSDATALVHSMSAANDRNTAGAIDMRRQLAASQESSVDHVRSMAGITVEMDTLHAQMREAQRNAAAALAEVGPAKQRAAECLVSMQTANERVVDAETLLQAEITTRVRVEDELGSANAQSADLSRRVRELKIIQKEQGTTSEDLVDSRVALSAAREEVDVLRLRLSGYEQEERVAGGGLLTGKKIDFKSLLETAKDELLCIFKLGRTAADGVDPTEVDTVSDEVDPTPCTQSSEESNSLSDGMAAEAVQDALNTLTSRANSWSDQFKALEAQMEKNDEEAQAALDEVIADKEDADARAKDAEKKAGLEAQALQAAAGLLDTRVEALRAVLIDNETVIRMMLDTTLDGTVHHHGTPPSSDPDIAEDHDLVSNAKDHLDAVRVVMDLITADIKERTSENAALTAAAADDWANIAALESEVRAIGEVAANETRERVSAMAELQVAGKALAKTAESLLLAETRACAAELRLNVGKKTLGTQAGPGLLEPVVKKEAIATPLTEAYPTKQYAMDDGVLPALVDKIIPREPPPQTPRVLKPAGWGSTWAAPVRTRLDPPIPNEFRSRGVSAATSTAPGRRHEAPSFPMETAAERLGFRNNLRRHSASSQRGNGDDLTLYEGHPLSVSRPATSRYTGDGGDYQEFSETRHLCAASEMDPQPRCLIVDIMMDPHLAGPSQAATRPQTCPAPGDAVRSTRSTMHAASRRQELPMGKQQLAMAIGADSLPSSQHKPLPLRLGVLIDSMDSRQ